jgi:hypothetical protein
MIGEYPQEGKWCWANDRAGYGLPDGLQDRTPVRVIEEMMPHFIVENEHGSRWKLFLAQLDAGYTFWLDGEPCFENHPKAVHYLLNSLKRLEKEKCELMDFEISRAERRSDLRWYLERNGNDPDAPQPPGPVPRFTGSTMRTSTYSPRAPRQSQGTPAIHAV